MLTLQKSFLQAFLSPLSIALFFLCSAGVRSQSLVAVTRTTGICHERMPELSTRPKVAYCRVGVSLRDNAMPFR
ncbi:hypothetical protein B0J12DRAFT_218780 [Macrophomina phaseolina]|uniref:Secreted protein n=1 Tax=Macrophomina phaseolina TaxID=35725 RepID=A0ABQ8G166_9PEZI|nr:hypothetical protein B0J12DRAFT_218780 [Macrophomina phaseolina]